MSTSQIAKERLQYHKKNDDSKKKKSLLLKILLPISIVIIALILFLGFFFGCTANSNDDHKPDITQTFVIEQDTITSDGGQYDIPSGQTIYYKNGESVTLDYDLLDLKLLSETHDDITDFTVSGSIDFGFLVDFDMSFTLHGIDDATMEINSTSYIGGVIVGQTSNPAADDVNWTYSGNMNIDRTMKFDLECTGLNNVVGVLVAKNSSASNITVNGDFKIVSNGAAYGVQFVHLCGGSITINGTFNIESKSNSMNASAVYLYSLAGANDSKQIFNGNYSVKSTTGANCYGVLCGWDGQSAINSSNMQEYNGTFNITSTGPASAVSLSDLQPVNGTIECNGYYIVEAGNSNVACGIDIRATFNDGSEFKTKGAFNITAKSGDSYGIRLGSLSANAKLHIYGVYNIISEFKESYVLRSSAWIRSNDFNFNCLATVVARTRAAALYVSSDLLHPIIGGFYTINASNGPAYGCYAASFATTSVVSINACFSIQGVGNSSVLEVANSQNGASVSIEGRFAISTTGTAPQSSIFKTGSTYNGSTLYMNSSQTFCYSSQQNIINYHSSGFTDSYNWNGQDIASGSDYNDSNKNISDSNISFENVRDRPDNHFAIAILNDGIVDNVTNFNTSVKNTIVDFKGNSDKCPSVAVSWLNDIVSQF